ncbi:flagellar basal body L-ring protein FlgH [Saccharobesus litoralis]|uniref:Flagellar L-ring protein n=1 Tax=Saccharobesus litoralis TaxID=2172099 RepID=A0A2S0VUQ3_9ALTE|nr:flagellar basal body L-ring protein FlgH [Saccharobesus litoralis]AWB67951.1 flagellar basal body L-ring protein FlgH [Saccharobesus litoralis]
MCRFIVLFAITYGLIGCAAMQDDKTAIPNDPFYAPIFPEQQEESVIPTGSLFQANYSSSVYSDSKARRIGDIITVMLQENTSASKSAKAEYGKENDVALSPFTALGRTATVNGNPLNLSLQYESEFKGDSKADQSNSLNGQISVHVIKILPNGNLIVRGEKWLTLNTGKEYVRMTGILRPADISSSNTVASNRVANARIEYSGTGSFADANKQGWLSKFFYSDWFPF